MLLLPGLLVLVGVLVGLVLLLRPTLMRSPNLEVDSYSPRISAEVHTGEEQVLIHLAQALRVAMGRDQVAYGEIYVASSSDGIIRLASRSEIGRGFEGEIRVQPARRGTLAEYFVLRLPADESLHPVVLRLDRRIADALRAIDPHADVRLYREQVQRSSGRGMPPLSMG